MAAHLGDTIATIVNNTLKAFKIPVDKPGYPVSDNTPNNDTAIEALARTYNFILRYWRLRYS